MIEAFAAGMIIGIVIGFGTGVMVGLLKRNGNVVIASRVEIDID